MNAERRKSLAKAAELIEQAKELVSAAAEEERDYLHAMPENMQNGDKGTKAEECADTLDNVVNSLEEVAEEIERAVEA